MTNGELVLTVHDVVKKVEAGEAFELPLSAMGMLIGELEYYKYEGAFRFDYEIESGKVWIRRWDLEKED